MNNKYKRTITRALYFQGCSYKQEETVLDFSSS